MILGREIKADAQFARLSDDDDEALRTEIVRMFAMVGR